MNGIVIESERLFLKTFVPADAEELFDCIAPPITRFMTWEPPASREAFAEVWRAWLPAIDGRDEHYFVVRMRIGGRCLGIVGLDAMRTRCPELGIWLRADSHGRGLGKEAIAEVVRWASEELQPDYFEYPVAERNLASRRIAESLGGSIGSYRDKPKYRVVVYRIPRAGGR